MPLHLHQQIFQFLISFRSRVRPHCRELFVFTLGRVVNQSIKVAFNDGYTGDGERPSKTVGTLPSLVKYEYLTRFLFVLYINLLKYIVPTDGDKGVIFEGHTEMISGVQISCDGKRFVSGCWDSSVKIWNAKTAACELTLVGHASECALFLHTCSD
jgi:WD40 repeat protein